MAESNSIFFPTPSLTAFMASRRVQSPEGRPQDPSSVSAVLSTMIVAATAEDVTVLLTTPHRKNIVINDTNSFLNITPPFPIKKPNHLYYKATRLSPVGPWLIAPERPVVFRICFTAGLAFSYRILTSLHEIRSKNYANNSTI